MKETLRTDYYVYAYLRQRDSKRAAAGTPYYIGKGQGYRIHEKSGHPFLPKKERRIKIAENLTEQDALDLEMELIEKYGRIAYDEGGILYNMSLGGEGYSIHRTEESRQAARQAYLNSEKGIATAKRARKKRLERMRADTEDGRMRRKAKRESDKRYRENPKYKDKLLQKRKEYNERTKDERNRKARERRATPEGKAKKAAADKRYREEVIKKDPVKLARRRRMARENAIKNNRLRGIKPREECGRKFKVVSPDGKVYEGIQCKPFAEKHNLDPTCFTAMCRGDLTHHNGWSVYGFKPPEGKKQRSNGSYFPTRMKNSKQFSFKMVDPQGNIHEGFNQREFSEKHGLNYKKVNAVLKGKRNHTGGWKLYKETKVTVESFMS